MKRIYVMILIFILSLVMIGCTTMSDDPETVNEVALGTEVENDPPIQETQNKETTILSETSFTDQNGRVNTATLFYDGDIRLSVNNLQTIIDSNVSGDFLNNNNSNVPQPSYSLHILGNQPLIAVVNDFPTINGPATKMDLFTYNGQELQTVFMTSDIECQLDAIDYEKGEVIISLPFTNTTVTYVLTSEERAQTEEKSLEFKSNKVKIDDEYIKSIKDGIICQPIEVAFTDADDDGIEEIFITSNIQSVGARTPVRINTNAVFVFEILNNEIQFKDFTF